MQDNKIIIKLNQVSVVILNWNGKVFLSQFLPKLIKETPNADIVVADNASNDDSVSFLKNKFPNIKLIINDKNYGFAGGYNKALSQIDSKYYVLLNSDIEVSENWLEPMIKIMELDDNIACCQPKILNYHNRDFFEYAGASGGYIDYLGFPFCRGRIFNTLEKDNGQYNDIVDIFWATGACLLVRSEIYKKIGGLDDDFFAHMEEIDFCWRIQNLNKRIIVVPESKVFHIGGGTLPKKSAKKTFLNFRNNYYLLYKNLPHNKTIKILTYRLFIDWIASVKFLLNGNFGDSLAVIKAQIIAFSSFNKFKEKRRKNKNFSNSLIYSKSIIFEYFFKKINKFSKLNQRNFTKFEKN